MASVWDNIADTAKSLGGALGAPAGVVWDLASGANPLDDKDFDISNTLMRRGGDLLDPVLNQDTFTGYGADKVMDAANWTMDNVVSEPISTTFTQVQHAAQGDTVGERFGRMFSGDDWKRAYEIAQEQNAGQSFATMVLDTNLSGQYDNDPFDYENPYDEVTHPEHGGVATGLSWGANIAGSLALDPFYLAGKGVGIARQASMGASGYGRLSPAQRSDLGRVLNADGTKASGRIDRWADFVSKANPEGRALTGPEILATTPELTRWAKEPRLVSALVADAAKIGDDSIRRNTIKDILAVAGGDMGALDRLQASKAAMPALADQLKNMRRGNVLDLEKLAANPDLQFSPMFTQHLERQLSNLNTDKGIDKAMRLWEDRLDLIERTHGSLTHLPGVHRGLTGALPMASRGGNLSQRLDSTAANTLLRTFSGKSDKGLRVANDKGLGQRLSQGADALESAAIGKVDAVSARIAAKTSHSLMVQKGLRTVPVLAIKTTAFAAAPYTKFPAAMAGAMRQTHFTGVARFDEWDDAVTQFDSMLRLSHVPSVERMGFVSKASLAGSEMEKEAMVRQAERLAMKNVTKHFSAKTGENISESYIEELMERHFRQRGARMSQLYGRAYAATSMPAEQQADVMDAAMRQGNITKAEDAAKWNLRVDQFLDDDGLPVALPLLESQLRNAVPLLDMHLAKRLVQRDQSHLSRLGRAWEKQAEEINGLETKLGRAKGRAADSIKSQLDRAYAAQDWIGELGAKSLRVWKMSVLFRLGYPARVVLDDHWRIWSRIGAGTFYAQNTPEALKNLGYNQVGRYRQAGNELASMRAELGSLKDELRSDRIAAFPQRAEAHRKAANSLRGHRGQITKLRAQLDGADSEWETTADDLFHGTDQSFEVFGTHGRRGRHGTLGASYFTEDPAIAKKFGEDRAYGYLDIEGPEFREFSLHGDATDADLQDFLRDKGVAKNLERLNSDDEWVKATVDEVTISDALEGRVRRLVKPNARTIKAKVYGKTLDLRHPRVNGFYTHPEQMRAWLDEQPEVVQAWIKAGKGPVANNLRRSLERRGDAVNWREHDGDSELLDFARKNGFGKVRVYDANTAGDQSVIALDEMIAHNRQVGNPLRQAIEEKIAHHEQQIARFEAELDRLQQAMGDVSPEDITARMDELNAMLKGGVKGNLPDKRTIGTADVELSGGEKVAGAFAGPQGRAMRGVTGSSDTFEYQISGVEQKTYGRADRGAHVTVNPDAPHHLDAWADSLNNQIRNSRAAMYFVRGGDSEGFAKWIREPEQADLRRRLPHLAHDPEDWGARIESMVDDYLPTTELREAMKKGTVTPKWLAKHHPDGTRPAVHGPMVADTLGTSDRSLGIGRRVNDTFTWLASQPTDRLSRHPFFNSMYKIHAEEFAELRRVAAREQGRKFTPEDMEFIERQARKAALVDLKRTLFDMSAHSHAAHVMRFISPFFAAHQEVITRWWRIVQDNPGIVRRVQQAFDAPRHAGIVVDENGDPVEPGEMPSPKHKMLLPIPWADGADWSINENSFNLILQNGITNPGVGPLAQVPLEYLATKYPEDEDIARVARIFSPFPPDSPTDAIMPATFKRLMAAMHGSTGIETGVGTREFNDLYATNITDKVVDFHLKNGREPTQSEMDDIWEDAKHESTVEAWLKFTQNAGSPFPARPNSRYAAIQQGWYKLSEQGRNRHPNDFIEARDWATAQFKEQYGEAYLALTYSDVNNPAGVDGSPAEVSAAKRYKSILDKTDKRLAMGVMGPALTAADEAGMTTERTPEGRQWFENQGWIDSDDPESAAREAQARRGWQMLDDVTNRLNLAAEQMGLGSYVENEKLVLVRRSALAAIKEENESFKADIESIDGDSYDSLLREMEQLTQNRTLRRDPTRTDISTLAEYLELRSTVMDLIQRRQAAGLGGPDAAATEPIREAYTKVVGQLAAQNTFFESGFFNPVISRDPLLIGLE